MPFFRKRFCVYTRRSLALDEPCSGDNVFLFSATAVATLCVEISKVVSCTNSQKTTWRTWNLFQLKDCRAIECHSLIIIMNTPSEWNLSWHEVCCDEILYEKWQAKSDTVCARPIHWWLLFRLSNCWLFCHLAIIFVCIVLEWANGSGAKIITKYEMNYRRTISVRCSPFNDDMDALFDSPFSLQSFFAKEITSSFLFDLPSSFSRIDTLAQYRCATDGKKIGSCLWHKLLFAVANKIVDSFDLIDFLCVSLYVIYI